MHSLPVFLRLTGRKVIVVGDGEAAAAKRRLLARAGAVITGPADNDARLAIVAIADDEAAHAAIAALRARGVLINAVDRPDACDFTLPAIVDRDPVLIAIGTGGASAGLAKALRQRLEQWLPSSLGPLAEALGTARAAIRRRWPDATARRHAIDDALAPGGRLDPLILAGDVAMAVQSWAAGAPDVADAAPATLRVIHIDSDDADRLRIDEARWLASADRVLHAPAVPAAILDRARADAPRMPAKTPPASDYLSPGLTVWIGRAAG